MSSPPPSPDAFPPREIAQRAEELGVSKARADALTLLVLAILAGAFIALGGLFYSVVISGSQLGFGVTRLLGGLSFSLGLILVVIAGAELFTGNNLLAMAWASGRISTAEVLRNWLIVYAGNLIGCFATVVLVLIAGLDQLGGGMVGETAQRIAAGKLALTPLEAFGRGVLCNVLVCLAVWLALGGRSVTDKLLAIVLPITAFVTVGAEHSIANAFFLPWGLALDASAQLDIAAALGNLLWVTLGNLVGGTLLVAGVYWLAYLRPRPPSA